MPINVIVCGAAGRMGKLLVSLVHENTEMLLAGAVEASGHWASNKDAGEVAGVGPIGLKVSDDYGAVATPDTVTLDFTIPEAALDHLRTAAEKGAAIVIGTTGFSAAQRIEADALGCKDANDYRSEYEYWCECSAKSRCRCRAYSQRRI